MKTRAPEHLAIVSCVSSVVDDKTGVPFAWNYRIAERDAVRLAARINAGKHRDAFGEPFRGVVATVTVEGGAA
jgi:hypothetical protein